MNEYSVKKMSEYPVNPSPLSEDLIPTITVEGGKFVNRNIEFSKLKGDKGDTGPQGEPGNDGNTGASGKAATVQVGSVITGPAGSSATVGNTGDEYDAVLDFTIPKGDKGDQGDPGVVQSVNGKSQEDVVLDTDDIADTATNRYTNDTDIARLADTSGENTGDQDLSGLATDAELTAGLATKEPTITAGTTAQYYRGDKTWQTLNTTAVGIPNVDNTSDMDKPVSTATQTALNGKVSRVANETITGEKTFLNNIRLLKTTLSITPTGTYLAPTTSNQGLATDGTYMYVAPNHQKVDKRLLSDGSLLGSITISDKVGGVYYYSANGLLYTAGGTFSEPFTGFICVINPVDMSLVDIFDVTAYTDYGLDAIVVIDDVIYVGETAASTDGIKSWYKFGLDGTYIAKVYSEATSSGTNDWQDATYYDGYIIATDHNGIVSIFDGVGTDKLVKVASYTYSGRNYMEGITNVDGTFYLYDSISQSIVIATGSINTVDGGYISPSGVVSLNNGSGDEKLKLTPDGVSFINGGGLVINGTTRVGSETLRLLQTADSNSGGIIQSSSTGTTLRTWISSGGVASINNGGTAGGVIALNGSGTGSVGINTTAPTHTLTLPSTATGIALYNTVDQTTNYERVRQYWSGGVFNILNEIGGTGAARAIRLGVYSGGLFISSGSTLTQGFIRADQGSVSGNQSIFSVNGSLTASGAIQAASVVAPAINQSGTAGYTAILANVTETATGSGPKNLIDLQVGGSSRFRVSNGGVVTFSSDLDVLSGRFQLGNGGAGATALFDLGAANTSRASMRVRAGVAPTSPNDGDIWYDGTELKMRMAGVTQTVALSGGGSGITRSIVTTSGNVTAGATASTDYVYIIAGAHTVTLPTAVGNTNKYDLNNASGSPVSLAFTSGQTANGGGVTLGVNESITLISDNANWRIL